VALIDDYLADPQRLRQAVAGMIREHLMRCCARPAFAIDRLSVIRGDERRPERVRYSRPRHKRDNCDLLPFFAGLTPL